MIKTKSEINHNCYMKHRDEYLRLAKIYSNTHPEIGKRCKENYKRNHPERYHEIVRKMTNKFRAKVKLEVLSHYSQRKMICACCGITEVKFLTLDHVNGHGDEPRNKRGRYLGGIQLYLKLRRMKYPEGYQVLCFNCNCAKGFYGICPHQKNKSE